MLELYGYLQTRPTAEVDEIIRRIRSNADPFTVLRFIQDGDLLLPGRVSSLKTDSSNPQMYLSRLHFDPSVYSQNYTRVPARPWTTLASDELVSQLIDTCLRQDSNIILSYIDRDVFLAEMTAANPTEAKFCSPALVNALCSLGAFTSHYALAVDAAIGGSMRTKFYDEARRLLDSEAGRPSLPSAQALLTLYMYSTAAAMDRAGYVFRIAACEMFRRLGLGTRLPPQSQTYDKEARRAFSRNGWGFFCLER